MKHGLVVASLQGRMLKLERFVASLQVIMAKLQIVAATGKITASIVQIDVPALGRLFQRGHGFCLFFELPLQCDELFW